MRSLNYIMNDNVRRMGFMAFNKYGRHEKPFDIVRGCTSCPRAFKVGPPVRPIGPLNAKFMIVGACPGRQEVTEGIPFNPNAPGGNYLRNYLNVLGLSREEVFITNSCHCLDLVMNKDRLPTEDEENICSAWKVYEWLILKQVKFVLLLGKNAVRQAFGPDYPSPTYSNGNAVGVLVGEKRKVVFFVTHHPGYLLRRPKLWDEVEPVLKSFKNAMEKITWEK